ncbi:MAG TPA: sugar phosphate isomerase/epimerase family protein [Chthonomonadales bacterium]|nr:sugar phosphate isomerase/epimerase family protein [Chthonomonadales bacterium]
MLSVTTDYATDRGCPEPYLRRIADHGFSHVHWCHQWNTDFLYSEPEIAQIERWMRETGLGLTDLHASEGVEKRWTSAREYERQAGVELVRNRVEMTARLGGDVAIMHIGSVPEGPDAAARFWDQLWRSLDELTPVLRTTGVRIAIENGVFAHIRRVFERYGPDVVGLCYDCGHGNMSGDGLDETEALSDRLISLHLHDNDGTRDLHMPLFTGTVDWPRLARIIARAPYSKWVSMETTMGRSGIADEDAFLRTVYDTGMRFTAMIEEARGAA